MTKRLLLAMAIGSVVLGCNKDSTVNRVDPSGGGEAGGGATGGALGGSGGGTTGGTGGTTEGSGGGTTGGVGTGGSSTGGEGGDTETTGGEGGEATTTGGAGTGGAGGEGGEAATTGGEGGEAATTGGEGGAGAATGGQATGGAATGGATTGGEGGGAGTGGGLAGGGAGGAMEGGAGGAGGEDATVRGKVIDFWRHPIPNIPVEVNGTVTTTDDDGEFEVADVPAVYDASLVIDFEEGAYTHHVYGWVYQDLTRRDPTLQVYRGLPNRSVPVEFVGENAAEVDEPLVGLSIAGPDGTYPWACTNTAGCTPLGVSWFGPTTTTATAHALLMRLDPDTDLPMDFIAYDSPLIVLVPGAPGTVSLDLSADEIPSGNLLGTVTASDDSSRENRVFVRFPTGGSIELLSDAAGPNSFSYLVPNLPQGSITVAAAVTDAYGGFSLAHQDGLAAGSEPVSLTLPTPSSLTLPIGGATGVDSTTSFRFVGSPESDAYLVVMSSYSYNTGLFIVTSREELAIPEVLGGAFQLIPDDIIDWWVETHGDAGSVDELAASGGFMDAFSADAETPKGPRLGSGSYTASDYRSFTTAP